jgi:hypothetical protein
MHHCVATVDPALMLLGKQDYRNGLHVHRHNFLFHLQNVYKYSDYRLL